MKTFRTTSRIEYNEAIRYCEENNIRFFASYNKILDVYEITVFEI